MAPRRALQVCPTPGCPTLTPGGRCDPCQRKAGRQRPSAASKGYDTRWARTRAAYLRAHPYCECHACQAQPPLLRPRATEVNHRDGLGPLGPRGHDWANLQAMTKAHHSRETAKHQPGGWNDREE
ncbi:HNH endonuclease [Streptomyces sp. NPDC004610]|uniref:HNH endonuclease n=1 Tax=unclassified Streptomyces TaxID=2593676 RepID=UPI00339EC3D2